MVKEFLLSIFFDIFKKIIPIISKKIYPLKEFVSDIKIHPRIQTPVSITLDSEIPNISIWFEIENNSSYLDILLAGGVFSLWVKDDRGYQPLFKQESIKERLYIKSKKEHELHCTIELKQSQLEYLKKSRGSKELTSNINLTIYIESLLYKFVEWEKSFENIYCKV